mgnify:CR=1 FL=1
MVIVHQLRCTALDSAVSGRHGFFPDAGVRSTDAGAGHCRATTGLCGVCASYQCVLSMATTILICGTVTGEVAGCRG